MPAPKGKACEGLSSQQVWEKWLKCQSGHFGKKPTMAAFCARNPVSVPTLVRWKRQSGPSGLPPGRPRIVKPHEEAEVSCAALPALYLLHSPYIKHRSKLVGSCAVNRPWSLSRPSRRRAAASPSPSSARRLSGSSPLARAHRRGQHSRTGRGIGHCSHCSAEMASLSAPLHHSRLRRLPPPRTPTPSQTSPLC